MILSDVSTNFGLTLRLANIFTKKQFNPLHLLDVLEDLLQNIFLCDQEKVMLLHWSEDTQAALNPLRVVVVNITYHYLNQSMLIGKPFAIAAFPFEDAPEAFQGAVINTMGHTRHTLDHSSLFQFDMKFSAGILKSPVAVEQRLGARICPHGFIKCPSYTQEVYHCVH